MASGKEAAGVCPRCFDDMRPAVAAGPSLSGPGGDAPSPAVFLWPVSAVRQQTVQQPFQDRGHEQDE